MAIRLPTSGALVQARVKYLSTDRPRIILHCQRDPGPPAINHYQSVPSASHPNTKTTSFPQTRHFFWKFTHQALYKKPKPQVRLTWSSIDHQHCRSRKRLLTRLLHSIIIKKKIGCNKFGQ